MDATVCIHYPIVIYTSWSRVKIVFFVWFLMWTNAGMDKNRCERKFSFCKGRLRKRSRQNERARERVTTDL